MKSVLVKNARCPNNPTLILYGTSDLLFCDVKRLSWVLNLQYVVITFEHFENFQHYRNHLFLHPIVLSNKKIVWDICESNSIIIFIPNIYTRRLYQIYRVYHCTMYIQTDL